MFWFKKKKEEVLEQIVYDTTYKGICPVCKTPGEEDGHTTEFLGKVEELSHKLLIECENCHAAFYAARGEVIKTLKKYVEDDKAWLGLKVISEEVIK